MTNTIDTAPKFSDCNVVELRQYTLRPDKRDVLIDLFDTWFVEPQEAAGIRVMGQFRDLGDPDKFVWVRGFSDMQSRSMGLESFYFGPVWAKHREAANATMVDSDDVLLLQPAWQGSGLRESFDKRPTVGSHERRVGRVLATVFHLREPADPELLSYARIQLTAALLGHHASEVAWYATSPAKNTFPKLPVREGEHVLVAFARMPGAEALERVRQTDLWADHFDAMARWLIKPSQNIYLEPTSRSLIGD
jgi:hypothetical protein